MCFIWSVAKHGRSKSVMFRPKLSGGLGVPNVVAYYYAVQIAPLTSLQKPTEASLWTLWNIEEVSPIPMYSAYPQTNILYVSDYMKNHPISVVLFFYPLGRN